MRVTIATIKRAVSEHYGIDIAERTNRRDVARPRQAAMFLATRLTEASLPNIGRRFERHHTTVLDARERIAALSQADIELHKDLLDITRFIFSEAQS